jgi:hypothetical protein
MQRVFHLLVAITLLPSSGMAADYAPPVAPPLPEFGGFYAAVGAGYGVSTWRNYFMREFLDIREINFNRTGEASGQVTPQGWFGTSMIGYNIQYGWLLGGLELTGRWGKEGADGPTSRSTFVTTAGFVGNVDHSYQFRSDSGVSLAARAGVVLGQTLLFGKLGLGVAHADDRFFFHGSGSACVVEQFIGNKLVCTAAAPMGSASLTIARWSPSVVAGVGMEHNIGRFFLRVGAELEGIYGLNGFSNTPPANIEPKGVFNNNAFGQAGSEAFWTTRGTALVGFRF